MKKTIPKILIAMLLVTVCIASCKSKKQASITPSAEQETFAISDAEQETFQQVAGDTISISSDKTEYEITIIEPGFNAWLLSIARPEGYYTQSYLENRNQIWVVNWNQRVLQPQRFSPRLYEMQIDYQPHIDYGYEVNYKLYNYFIYFQRKYKQRLGTFSPRL